jgi:hypothetical protein
MQITDLCPNPTLVDVDIITDPPSLLDTEVLKHMWLVFRATHPVSQARFPDVSHLRAYVEAIPSTDLERYRQSYDEIVRRIFLPLLDHDRILVHFVPNQRNAGSFAIVKTHTTFTLCSMKFSPTYYDKVLTAFNMFDYQTKYHGPKYLVAMFHFDEPTES